MADRTENSGVRSQMDRQQREKIERSAYDCMQSGFCCSESVFKIIAEQFGDRPDESLPKAAAAFMGGVGGTEEEICGALAGGVLAIGYLMGRTDPGVDMAHVHRLATEFRKRFLQEFGATRCGALLEILGKQDDYIRCKRMTGRAAGILADLIEERREL